MGFNLYFFENLQNFQAVVTEYLIRYSELIFSDKLPAYSSNNPTVATPAGGPETTSTILAATAAAKNRPKSLAISTPTKLMSLEEARNRALTACNNIENQKYIEVGGGPDNLPSKYHTVIELPGGGGKKGGGGGGSFKHRKTAATTAWKAIFVGKEKKTKSTATRKTSTPSELNLLSVSQVRLFCFVEDWKI